MIDLLQLHKYFILSHLKEGGIAVDFTMGNGNDTLFLSKAVGKSGHVYAFDIQERALEVTRKRLEEDGAPQNYTLIYASHHRVKEFVKCSINAGMFNLGYLPGSGKKELYTKRETTLPAIKDALELLAPDGILLVAVYPGHEEGRLEGETIKEHFSTLSRFSVCVSEFRIINSPASPYFFIAEKK